MTADAHGPQRPSAALGQGPSRPAPVAAEVPTGSADGLRAHPEAELIAAFTDLSDGLAADADSAELLARLVEQSVTTLSATVAGVVLCSPQGSFAVLAASDPTGRVVEDAQVEHRRGPCVDCVQTGHPVAVADLAAAQDWWPGWRPQALAAGVRSVLALPLIARGVAIGALDLYADRADAFTDRDTRIATGLARVAAAVVVTHRNLARARTVTDQLERALQSRVVIEQAKGVVAAVLRVDVDTAFDLVRSHCRRTNQRISEVSDALRSGRLDADALLPPRDRRP